MGKLGWLTIAILLVLYFMYGEQEGRERFESPKRMPQSESYMRFGVGTGASAVNSRSETKTFAIGYSDQLVELKSLSFLIYQYEGGFWWDTAGKGRESSLYGSSGVGVRVHAGPYYASSVHGAGVISSPDSYLGTIPQFFHDVSLGLEDDENHATMGISYKHISNGGVIGPNRGRDFISFRVGVPF